MAAWFAHCKTAESDWLGSFNGNNGVILPLMLVAKYLGAGGCVYVYNQHQCKHKLAAIDTTRRESFCVGRRGKNYF